MLDSYYKKTKEYSLLNYFLFVTFLPQLIAGPIVHHKEMMPQFEYIKKIIPKNIIDGLVYFSIGLFKKTVIADTFAIVANYGFRYTNSLSTIDAIVVILAYTFQIYFDFSGYSDMAISLGRFFNIKLPINFNSPYKSLNIQEFWRRWHITLFRFLRDYIYIPLGGNRVSKVKTYINIFITFLIGGIWHGAGWTFIIWGILHSFALILNRIFKEFKITLNKYISWALTFSFVVFTWIFFRAKDLKEAFNIINALLSFSFYHKLYYIKTTHYKIYLLILMGFIISLLFKNSNEIIENLNISQKTAIIFGVIFAIGVLFVNRTSEFIYFNF